MNNDWYRTQARKAGRPDVMLEVEADAPVSRPPVPPHGPGAWVQAWVWVPDRKEADDDRKANAPDPEVRVHPARLEDT